MTDGSLQAHVAGRIVTGHPRPAGALDVPVTDRALDARFLARWVEPFYLELLSAVAAAPARGAALAAAAREADDAVLDALLAEADWRPRLVGAWLVALRQARQYEDRLGRLLLRSDVCYAGQGYCLALASFATPTAADYLARYLEHYLARPELQFEQITAMAALRHVAAARAAALQPAWEAFLGTREDPAARAGAHLAAQLAALEQLRALPAPRPAPAPLFPPAPPPARGWRARLARWFGR